MIDFRAVRAFLESRHAKLGDSVARFAAVELAEETGPKGQQLSRDRPGSADAAGAAVAGGAPPAADDDLARRRARSICVSLGRRGWLRAIGDQDFRACCVVRESLAYRSALADSVFALQALGTTPIILAGTAPPHRQWLDRALSGSAIAAFALTESEAGSDLAGVQTTAVRHGDSYVLNGSKTFISNAGIADFYIVLAATDPGAGAAALSAFLVPADTEGLRFVRPQLLADPLPLGEISFEECTVPLSARLAGEGEGYKLGLATLDRLRPTVGAAACGMAGRALQEAVSHARSRRQFGRALSSFQITQAKIARMLTGLTAARLLVYRAAWERDGGAERTDAEAAMAKSFATETAQRIVDEAVQILGGKGVLRDSPVNRLYQSVRALRIYEGTTEILQLIIARHLLDAGTQDAGALDAGTQDAGALDAGALNAGAVDAGTPDAGAGPS